MKPLNPVIREARQIVCTWSHDVLAPGCQRSRRSAGRDMLLNRAVRLIWPGLLDGQSVVVSWHPMPPPPFTDEQPVYVRRLASASCSTRNEIAINRSGCSLYARWQRCKPNRRTSRSDEEWDSDFARPSDRPVGQLTYGYHPAIPVSRQSKAVVVVGRPAAGRRTTQ